MAAVSAVFWQVGCATSWVPLRVRSPCPVLAPSWRPLGSPYMSSTVVPAVLVSGTYKPAPSKPPCAHASSVRKWTVSKYPLATCTQICLVLWQCGRCCGGLASWVRYSWVPLRVRSPCPVLAPSWRPWVPPTCHAPCGKSTFSTSGST